MFMEITAHSLPAAWYTHYRLSHLILRFLPGEVEIIIPLLWIKKLSLEELFNLSKETKLQNAKTRKLYTTLHYL